MTSSRNVEVQFTDDAVEDLRRIGPDVVPRVLKKLLMVESSPEAGRPLGGELTGFRKLVVGKNTWRIVYKVTGTLVEICEVWAVGMRRDSAVYAAATKRVSEAAETQPHLSSLAEVLARLGRLSGSDEVHALEREAVPDWLAARLVHTGNMTPAEVAAMDAEEALDAWTAFITKPK